MKQFSLKKLLYNFSPSSIRRSHLRDSVRYRIIPITPIVTNGKRMLSDAGLGVGTAGVAATVDPGRMVAMYNAIKQGDYKKALALHYALFPLIRSMFIDTNPIPVKKAMELLGMAGGPVRLPLDELDAEKTLQLKKVLSAFFVFSKEYNYQNG